MKFIYLLTILVLLLTACSQHSLELSNQNIQAIPSITASEIQVSSLCELFDNPYPFQRKVVRLKTTIYSIHTGNASFGDKRCEQRHSLIDVDFSPGLKTSVCKKENSEQEMLCNIAIKTGNNINGDNYVVVADVIGYFEYYETNEGFTRNGLRFHFLANKIENIEKITSIKEQRLQ